MVASAAGEQEWAERTAASLAAGWAGQGRRILLADFALDRPGLHRVLQTSNGEGVSDAFLFGSSVQRVARPVRDGRFLLMPAGTATARADEITASPRWASIVNGCASEGTTLVVFLPSDLAGGEALLRSASDVLLLTDSDAVPPEGLARDLGSRLRGILVPPNGRMEADEVAAAPLVAEQLADEESAPLAMLDLGSDLAGTAAPVDEEVTLPPLPGFDEPDPDVLTLPVLDDEPPAPAPSAAIDVDPWAEAETEREWAAPGGAGAADELGPGFDIELGRLTADTDSAAEAPVEPAGEATLGDAGLDLGDLQSPEDPLMPEPVTQEQEREAAALFDLSSFDGMVENAPPPPPRAPVILESEEEPIVLGGAAPPPRGPAPSGSDDQSAGFDLAGAVDAPSAAAPAAPAPRPSRSARPAAPAAEAVPRPTPKPRPKAGESATGSLVGLGIMAVLIAAVALAWFGIVEIPWLSGFLAARRAPAESSVPAAAPVRDGQAPTSAVLYASLALGAFADRPVARLQAESLARQRPELLFVVAPVVIDGVVYHRLLADPARDSSELVTLRARLATLLTREDPASWRLQRTPLAFDLGETDDLRAARARVEALSRVDIPAYVLELPALTGPTGMGRGASGFVQVSSRMESVRYRVYAGAYADAHEAAYLADLLAKQGESQARLIERTGRHIE